MPKVITITPKDLHLRRVVSNEYAEFVKNSDISRGNERLSDISDTVELGASFRFFAAIPKTEQLGTVADCLNNDLSIDTSESRSTRVRLAVASFSLLRPVSVAVFDSSEFMQVAVGCGCPEVTDKRLVAAELAKRGGLVVLDGVTHRVDGWLEIPEPRERERDRDLELDRELDLSVMRRGSAMLCWNLTSFLKTAEVKFGDE